MNAIAAADYSMLGTNIVNHIDRFMQLAFKAQNQCRATVATLAFMKNPPVVIAQHANVAHGPRQSAKCWRAWHG